MFDFRSFFLNNFPYTDFHELNLDFILRKIGAIDGAVEEATEAATTATEVAGTAQSASFTAVEASQAAVSAKNSAVSAKFDAESARDAAQTAATNAASSATTASQRAAAALASQNAAETARTGAEAARDAAQTARSGAQTARTGAETAATNAENSAAAAATSAQTAAQYNNYIQIEDGTNFNTLTAPGWYFITTTNSTTNNPGNLTYSYMQVYYNSSNGRVVQIAYGGRVESYRAIYVRYRASSAADSWTAWHPLYFDDVVLLTDNANFDNITTPGTYFITTVNNATNNPGNLTYSYMQVFSDPMNVSNTRIVQIAYGGRAAAHVACYIRYRASSAEDSWTGWHPIYFDDYSDYRYNATIPAEGEVTSDICSYYATASGRLKMLRLFDYVPKIMTSGSILTVGTLNAAFRPMNEFTTCVPITAGANAIINITTAGVVTIKPLQDVSLRVGGQTVTVTYF